MLSMTLFTSHCDVLWLLHFSELAVFRLIYQWCNAACYFLSLSHSLSTPEALLKLLSRLILNHAVMFQLIWKI